MSAVGWILFELVWQLERSKNTSILYPYLIFALISSILWICAYHIRIKKSKRISDNIGLVLLVPLTGSIIISLNPLFGFIVYLITIPLFLIISYLNLLFIFKFVKK